MRRSAVPVAVLALVLVAACGSSSGSGSAGATAPSASATASEAPLTAAEGHKIAVAAQVQAADLPGFAEDKSAAGNADAPDATDKEIAVCISGTADPHYLADVKSSDFSKGTPPSQLQVSSETQVVPNTRQGTQELAKLKEPATATCMNNALKKALSAQAEGGTFDGQLKPVPMSQDYGSDAAVRYSLDGAFKAQGISVTMHIDLDALLVGRAEVTLSSFAVGEKPLAAPDRDRILKALVDRARAAQQA